MDKPRTDHLDFLDGMRACAAFYVLLTHAYNLLFYAGVGAQGGGTGRAMTVFKPLAFGRYAVDMFIVLSGYCLMLPVVRSGVLRGGFAGYIRRRAWRIVPPYYAALILTLLLLFLSNLWLLPAAAFPVWGDVAAHLLLVHNLFDRWAHSINSPMWSVASEWQIYFFFPALLLPVWRRWNATASVIVAFAVGYALQLLVPGGLDDAAPWYLGLFALGMAAAVHTLAPDRKPRPWGTVCVVLTAILAIVGSLTHRWLSDHAWLIDPVFGLAAVSLILYCVQSMPPGETGRQSLALSILRSRWAVGLGAFSYSLYLVHSPLVELSGRLFVFFALPPNVWIALTFGVCVPVTTALAYLFHLLFERPFMPGYPSTLRAAQLAAEKSPAP